MQTNTDTQAAGEPVADSAAAMANGEAIMTEAIGHEAMDQVLVIAAELESAEATAQPESDVPVKKPASRAKQEGCRTCGER